MLFLPIGECLLKIVTLLLQFSLAGFQVVQSLRRLDVALRELSYLPGGDHVAPSGCIDMLRQQEFRDGGIGGLPVLGEFVKRSIQAFFSARPWLSSRLLERSNNHARSCGLPSFHSFSSSTVQCVPSGPLLHSLAYQS